MKVVFRVDASIQIGNGHVIRCLTLSEALRGQGAEVHFICRELDGHLIEMISKHGFSISVLGDDDALSIDGSDAVEQLTNHSHWLGCDWRLDAEQSSKILSEKRPDWLVVDHYSLDHAWESEQRNHVGKIMVIDDLADRSHDCELLLDQNLGRQESDYGLLLPQQAKILVGPKYALLRPEFAKLREYSLERRKNPKVSNIIISMGGVDPQNATGKILEALGNCALPLDSTVFVVMGENAPWRDEIRCQAENLPWKTEVLIGISDMAQRLADSDLAIGAAGISALERCCLGVPTLVAILADNQRPSALHLSEAGISFLITIDELLGESLQTFLHTLQIKPIKLTEMSEKAVRVTDGSGCRIIVEQIFLRESR